MKKKILAAAVLTAAVVSGVFTGCGNDSDIGRDAALEVALGDAGVNESDATRLYLRTETTAEKYMKSGLMWKIRNMIMKFRHPMGRSSARI